MGVITEILTQLLIWIFRIRQSLRLTECTADGPSTQHDLQCLKFRMPKYRNTMPRSESPLPPHASLSLLNGLSGAFLDFDLLPHLLARVDGSRRRSETTADWAELLSTVEFEQGHVELADLPEGMTVEDSMAADAWRFAEGMGLIFADGLTGAGRKVAALKALDTERCNSALAPILAYCVDDKLLVEGDTPVLPLLLRAARYLAETTNQPAAECPRLIPVEVNAIVHWANVDLIRANEVVEEIVTSRDTAIHRYPLPQTDGAVGAHAEIHEHRVTKFYQEHPWLGERDATSKGPRLALHRLLAYCGLLDPQGDAVMRLEQRRFLRLKNQMIETLGKSVEFFSAKNKWIREKMVVEKLLKQLGIEYDESELIESEEPVDVAFRDARFQVKEVMQFQGEQPRRRHSEFKAALLKVQAAETMEDLMHLTPFREVTWDRIVTECVEAAKAHIRRYGVKERRGLDVVCYCNRQDHFERYTPALEVEGLDCRSFSIVSNSFAMVLFADLGAPAFLHEAVGTRQPSPSNWL